MKKCYLQFVLVLVLVVTNAYCQEIPIIKVDESELGLQSLDIKVDVLGNIATTTYDMLFFNPNDRVLEGELSFPLGQNQSVNYFALEINGNLREAVVVEKELGRVAFENTVRQQIDPALLEKTQGNNYKARIYPIPAKGVKRVVLSYQQELVMSNNAHYLQLPLAFEDELKQFDLEVSVFKQSICPVVEEGGIANFEFENWNENYIAKISKTNYSPRKQLWIRIPNDVEKEKVLTYDDYFYFYKTLEPNTRTKRKPKRITIYWDNSLSLKNRKIESEIELLDAYFRYLNDVKVDVIYFSNTIHETQNFEVTNGNWESIRKLVETMTYDGGTSFKDIRFDHKKTDEYLLFTDGMNSLSEIPVHGEKPVYTINSISKSDHKSLEQLVAATGGNYLNLNKIGQDDALGLLTNQSYRFLGYSNSSISNGEIYPNTVANVTNDFSISGKNFTHGEKVKLQFGYGNKVSHEIEVVISSKDNESDYVKSFWAQKKLNFLLKDKEQNKCEIIKLSKQYQLISPFTSLIVLDRVEDYVRYKIQPPEELKKAYDKLLAEANENATDEKEELEDMRDDLNDHYDNLLEWWKTDFKLVKNKGDKNISVIRDTVPISNPTVINSSIDTNAPFISGVVTDGTHPLPGVNVRVKNGTAETTTDFDGRYVINASENDQLEFSFLGMHSTEVEIEDSLSINIEMEEEEMHLDEVVTMAYSTHSVTRSLGGRVAGIEVVQSDDSEPGISIRGASSTSNASPIYIVDGVIVEDKTSLNPDDVSEMYMLNSEQGSALYGSRASGGVVIVTTKEGLKNNEEKIEALEELIDEKLELKPWDSNAPYLKEIKNTKSVEEAYVKYLALRSEYSKSPTFYIDMADYFDSKGERAIAIKILTNLAEVYIDNYELLKVLAYKLEFYGAYELAVYIYEGILELRPEDIQSYRDLALCYQEIGENQKSLDLLFKIVNGELIEKDLDRRFEGIEEIAFVEMNNLISKHGKFLNLNAIDENLIKEMPIDLRVVIDWNHNDTDIDLWVIEPTGEKCYYSHSKTKIGGRLSADMTDGFGPEEYLLKKEIKGKYRFLIDYYSDNLQKISGPTFLKISIFTNYGTKEESKRIVIHRLDKEEDELEVGKLIID